MVSKKKKRSVLKNIRQNRKRRERNRAIKKEAKKSIKIAIKSLGKGEAGKNLSLAFSKIDKAAKKGVFHKNKANRLKSKLSKRLAV